MEQIITLKVDLEYPEEAHHAIDEAVKVYEADKLKWTEGELIEAKLISTGIALLISKEEPLCSFYRLRRGSFIPKVQIWLLCQISLVDGTQGFYQAQLCQ